MAEIFKEAQAFNNEPKRWNHDLSHKVYGTFKMGNIYPVYSQFMQPSDSINLDIAALLQFMPTPAPLQSNVRVIFHVFAQRMKNIVESWPNFIEQLEEHEMPYILPHVDELRPGSIHDYLGVPVVYTSGSYAEIPLGFSCCNSSSKMLSIRPTDNLPIFGNYTYPAVNQTSSFAGYYIIAHSQPINCVPAFYNDRLTEEEVVYFGFPQDGETSISCTTSSLSEVKAFVIPSNRADGQDAYPAIPIDIYTYVSSQSSGVTHLKGVSVRYGLLATALSRLNTKYFRLAFGYKTVSNPSGVSSCSTNLLRGALNYNTIRLFSNGSIAIADIPHLCPYKTIDNPDAPIKIHAYRHRVYEGVYNAFYRNIHGNQPFVINGVTQYNKYNTTKADGADTTHYQLMQRNWELDAYTSCLPSPQQGNMPLVGVSATGRLTIEDDDGTRSTAQLQDLPDGQQGMSISQINASTDEHRTIMMNLASSGFTINDLRETNALQKFLETNIRKGFRYIDFIKGHYNVAPRHAEMDMPEFIGGFTTKLDVGKVTNTAMPASDDGQNVLGNFAGSAMAAGSSKHSIRYFADDYCYLMVTMCIVPDSAYSQVMPKDLLYNDPLDFPFPEFSQLGYQPITYEEFCPIEAYKDSLVSNRHLTDVFGYQRPQHELVWLPDTLHGQFLTTMNNYVINRQFDGAPELGNQFLTIKPEETQAVFTVTKPDNDIAFGQLGFHITMKRPVPRICIPTIGR